MKKILLSMLLLLMLGILSDQCRADEIDELVQQVAQQNQKIYELQKKLEKYEAGQQQNRQVLSQKVAELSDKTEAGLPDALKWVEKIKFYGDFRFRYEQIDAEKTGGEWKDGRSRNRIRARIGMNAKVTDEWMLGFRLATGSDDPVSTNQSLDGGFSSKDIKLDKAFLSWKSQAAEGLKVIGGKMGNPFHNVGKNQLIWDGDLTPEGVAAQYALNLMEGTDLFVNGGGFWVEENSSDADQSLWGIQGGLKHKIENLQILGGLSYYDYGNVEGRPTIYDDTDGFGNSVTEVTDGQGNVVETLYQNDYDILELFAELGGIKIAEMPLGFYGNYVINTGADSDEDQGWLIGATLNKAKNPGTWQFGYNYRDLEKDAVIGAYSDSDFIGGGTNGKGHKFGFKYQLAKGVSTGVTYLVNDVGDNQNDYRRLQIDLALKF